MFFFCSFSNTEHACSWWSSSYLLTLALIIFYCGTRHKEKWVTYHLSHHNPQNKNVHGFLPVVCTFQCRALCSWVCLYPFTGRIAVSVEIYFFSVLYFLRFKLFLLWFLNKHYTKICNIIKPLLLSFIPQLLIFHFVTLLFILSGTHSSVKFLNNTGLNDVKFGYF